MARAPSRATPTATKRSAAGRAARRTQTACSASPNAPKLRPHDRPAAWTARATRAPRTRTGAALDMTGDVIAWSLTVLSTAAAVGSVVWHRRQVAATSAAAERSARAHGAERARLEDERRGLGEKVARLEADLAREQSALKQVTTALDLLP